jgi:phospholipid N-methyltransferase
MHYWNECQRFFRQFRQEFHNTGSIMPSSGALARALTRPMRLAKSPRRILEVGPGTGAVTAEIVRWLRPDDRFDIVEINADFVAYLNQRFAEEPNFKKCRQQTIIHHAPLQDVPGVHEYDFMISGIPLANFSPELAADIYRSYERLLKPSGTLSFFEYAWLRDLKLPFVAAVEHERLTKLGRLLEMKKRRFQIAEQLVVMNVPPAVARHLRFGRC